MILILKMNCKYLKINIKLKIRRNNMENEGNFEQDEDSNQQTLIVLF